MRIGAGVEGRDDAASDVVVVGELGEVLVGEVGGSLQLIVADQLDDLDPLSIASAQGEVKVVVWWEVHGRMIERDAVRSLSARFPLAHSWIILW